MQTCNIWSSFNLLFLSFVSFIPFFLLAEYHPLITHLLLLLLPIVWNGKIIIPEQCTLAWKGQAFLQSRATKSEVLISWTLEGKIIPDLDNISIARWKDERMEKNIHLYHSVLIFQKFQIYPSKYSSLPFHLKIYYKNREKWRKFLHDRCIQSIFHDRISRVLARILFSLVFSRDVQKSVVIRISVPS